MIIDRSKLTKEIFTFFRLLQRISSSNFQLTFWSRSHVQGENRVWNVFHGRGTHLRLELGGGIVTHLFIRVADLGIPCSCDPGDLRPAHSRSRSAVPFRFIYEQGGNVPLDLRLLDIDKVMVVSRSRSFQGQGHFKVVSKYGHK